MKLSLSSIFSISWYQLLRFHAKGVIYLLLFSGLLLGFVPLFFKGFQLGPQELVIKDAAITLFGLLTLIFSFYLGVNLFQEEIEKKNIYPFLIRVTHLEYLLGGLLAGTLFLLGTLGFLHLELFLILVQLSGEWPVYLIQNFLSQFGEGFIWMNLAILFSFLFAPNLNFLLVFSLYILSHLPFQSFAELRNPGLESFFHFIKNLLPQALFFNLKEESLQKSIVSILLLSRILLYGLVYGLFLFGFSHWIFKRKDL